VSRKFKKVVASTLAIAMMAGTATYLPADPFSIIQAAEAGATVSISKNLTANPGETFTFTIDVTNNAGGYSSLITWLDIDERYFELVEWKAGDPSADRYNRTPQYSNTTLTEYTKPGSSNLLTLVQMYFDSNAKNLSGDNVFATVTLKVKEGTPDGNYTLNLDEVADGNTMSNRVVNADPVVLTPTYVDGMVKVGNGGTTQPPEQTTPAPQTTSAPQQTTPAPQQTTPAPQQTQAPQQTSATQGIVSGAMNFVLNDAKANAGDIVTVKLDIKNNTKLSAFQGELVLPNGFEIDGAFTDKYLGSWAVSETTTNIQFVSDDGRNAEEGDGTFAEIDIKIPAGTADGVYPITFQNLKVSFHNGTGQQVYDSSKVNAVAGYITVGNGGTQASIQTQPTQQTTPAPQQTTQAPQQTTQAPQQTPSQGVVSGAMNFVFNDAKANAGEIVTVKLDIKNNTKLSAFQGELVLPNGFTIDGAYTDKYLGSWAISEATTNIQFVSDDGRNAEEGDGTFAEIDIKIPAGTADGVYPITFQNLKVSFHNGTGQQVYDSSKVNAVAGYITVGNGGTQAPIQTQPTQNPSTTQAPQSGQFTVDIADATGAVGSNVKTTLDITGNPGIAGFTANLSYDKSALQFVSATSGNWDIEVSEDGTQIVAIANPYADVTTTGKAVELTFKPLTAGSHTVKVSSVEGAKKNETAVAGTGTAGTITVTGGNSSSDPQTPPSSKAMQFVFGDVKGKAGEIVTVKLDIKNNTKLSAFQGEVVLPNGFTIDSAFTDKYLGSWAISEATTNIQFVSDDGRNVEEGDGTFAEVDIMIPAGTPDGVYDISLKNLKVSFHNGTGQQVYTSSDVAAVAGTITIGEETSTFVTTPAQTTVPEQTQPSQTTSAPAVSQKPSESGRPATKGEEGPTVAVESGLKANAGETFTFKINVTNNEGGYSSLITWLDIDERYFELVEWHPGDPNADRYNRTPQYSNTTLTKYTKPGTSNLLTLVQMYFDANAKNFAGDNVFATVTLKVKEGTPDGVYPLTLDYNAEGNAMCNRVIPGESEKDVLVLNPLYISGSVQVGEPKQTEPSQTEPTQTQPSQTTPSQTAPTQTQPSQTTTSSDPVGKGMQFVFGDAKGKAGEIVTVKLDIKNNTSLSAFQGEVVLPNGFTIDSAFTSKYLGSWAISEATTNIQFVSDDGRNVEEGDGTFAEIDIMIPEGTPDGVYDISIENLKVSFHNGKGQEVYDASKVSAVAGTITVGEPTTTPSDKVTEPTQTTAPTQTQPSQTTSAPAVSQPPADSGRPNTKGEEGPTVAVQSGLKANAGETFTFKINVTNNEGGYSSLITWLDIDERYFELVDWKAGDPDADRYNRTPQFSNTTLTKYTKPGTSNLLTLVQMYFDANAKNFAGDNVFATVTLKVKEGTPDGVYPLTLDYNAEGNAMCNRVIPGESEKDVLVLNPLYISGSVQVGEPKQTEPSQTEPTQTQPSQTTPSQTAPTQTQPSQTTTSSDPVGKGMQFVFGDAKGKAGEIVTVKLDIKNNTSLSAFQGEVVLPNGFTIDSAFTSKYLGSWAISEATTNIQFVSDDGRNVEEGDGTFAEIDIMIPEGTPDGVYDISIENLKVSFHNGKGQEVYDASKVSAVAGTITVGEPTTTPSDKVTEPTQTQPSQTQPSQTTPSQTAPTQTQPSQTTTSSDPVGKGMQFVFGDAKGKAGDIVTVKLDIKNNTSLSAFQGEVILPNGFTIDSAFTSKYLGSWAISEATTNIQFVSDDGRNVEEGDGTFAEIDIMIPEGTPDGVYDISIENLKVSFHNGKGQEVYDASKVSAVAGTITVGEPTTTTPSDKVTEPTQTQPSQTTAPTQTQPSQTTAPTQTQPSQTTAPTQTQPSQTTAPTQTTTVTASESDITVTTAPNPGYSEPIQSGTPAIKDAEEGPTVDIADDYEVKAGESFTFTVDITNNELGYSSLIAWLDIDERYFELVEWKAGDPSADRYNRTPQFSNTTLTKYTKPGATNILTLVQMYFDANAKNLAGDNVFATITLKAKETTPSGTYALNFDYLAEGNAMCNRVIPSGDEKGVLVLNPLYIGGQVKVTNPSDVTTTTVTTTSEPEKTTTSVSATTSAPVGTTATTVTTSGDPIGDKMQIGFENITVNAGDTTSIKLNIKNNNGLSAFQGALSIEGGITYGQGYAVDYLGSWANATTTNFIQFVSDDGRNIEEGDGVLGEFDITVPANTPAGEYKIVLNDVSVSYHDGNGQVVIGADRFETVVATITVKNPGSEVSTTPTKPPVTTVTTVTTVTEPTGTTVTTVTEPTGTTVTTPTPGDDTVYGDVDNNGVVNARDLMKLKQYLLLVVGKEEVPNGDLNKDGKINAVDMVRLVQLLLQD